jgi:hypothetical protein
VLLVCAGIALAVEINWIRNRGAAPQPLARQAGGDSENIGNGLVTATTELHPPAPADDAPWTELAAYIRPKVEEEHWASLGWRSDLREAMDLAGKTTRLVFLWATNQPMGRC